MSRIILNGPAGRIEAHYHRPPDPAGKPVALILHAHPKLGGHMDSLIPRQLGQIFAERDFSVMRFNFRGVGHSQGEFEGGAGELADAAIILDWLQTTHADTTNFWVAGYSFGAWIGMQLLMRRPEIVGFISVAPPVGGYDFSFLAPCPSSGLIIHGSNDRIAVPRKTRELASHLDTQHGIDITHHEVAAANHTFSKRIPELMEIIGEYLDLRVAEDPPNRKELPRRVERGRQSSWAK